MLWNDQRCDMLEVAKRDRAADAHALALRRPAPHETQWCEERLRCRCPHARQRTALEAHRPRRTEPRKDLKYFDGLTPEISRRVSGRLD
jgi:hypothetical protein